MDTKIKLSIIVVSWNVRTLLEACLASVFRYAPQFPFEVIVIDNASHDASVDMITQKFSQVNCVANADNTGFASATNQGIKIARGEYILLLNPDTEVTEGSLEKLVSKIESDPKVGIVAPKLLNPDRTLQPSIRRFPTPFSQFLIFLKLRHLRRVPGAIQRYLNSDFDYEKTQEVDQPQGAAFLIRRSVLNAIGFFDEKFFIWFEEVDFCKRTQDAGWKIIYTPEAKIIHHGGQSFRQRFSLDKQILFSTSCAYYLWKHFSWKSLYAILPMKLYCTVLRGVRGMQKSPIFFITLAAIIGAEKLSLLGFVYPPFAPIGFFVVAIAVAALSFFKFEYGVMAVIAELIIGSKGYLLSFPVGESSISIRHVFFGIIFFAWIFHAFKKREFHLPRYLAPAYILLGVAVVGGIIGGYMNGYDKNSLFHDANAWPFFLMLIPFSAVLINRESISRFFSVASAALTAHVMKVLMIFYVMGHQGFGAGILETIYRWARVTGVAEITPFQSNVFRVFFQSQIYVLIAFCIFLAYAGAFFAQRSNKNVREILRDLIREYRGYVLLFIGSISVLMVSFSRSFWLAALCAGLVWLGVVLFQRYKIKAVVMACSMVFIGVFLSGIFLFGFSRFPVPATSGGFDFNLLAKRTGNISGEAAAASRWNSLPVLLDAIKQKPFFGYGFGKELTYISKDPRILSANPSGVYTTYAFEWGYLDMVVKFGVLGLACYLFFLLRILLQGWKSLRTSPLVFGVWLGVIAVMITHIFSPYLNHPLGIGYVVLVGVLFERFKNVEVG